MFGPTPWPIWGRPKDTADGWKMIQALYPEIIPAAAEKIESAPFLPDGRCERMTIRKMPLSALHQPEKNVRKHTDKQIGEYVRSLRMFGQVKPIINRRCRRDHLRQRSVPGIGSDGAAECDCYVMGKVHAQPEEKADCWRITECMIWAHRH